MPLAGVSTAMATEDDPVNETSDVFEYGDRTIFQLRAQPIDFDEQYGTIVQKPVPLIAPVVAPALDVAAETPASFEAAQDLDRVTLLERKLEAALRRIDQLQQRLDSIDATVARALNR
jgi:hypothetical protein